MTVPYDFEEAGREDDQGPERWSEVDPIPVKVMFNEVEVVAPAFTAWTSFTIQAGSIPVKICPHRYHREKARFLVTFAAASTSKLYIARVQDYLSSLSVANAFLVTLGQNIPDYEGQQQVFAIVIGPDPVTVSVMDMGHGEVQ